MRIVALAALLIVPVVWLGAQETSPTTNPTTIPTSRPSTVLEPVKEGTTQPAAVNLQYREGTFLLEQVGRLTKDKKGEASFVFQSGGKTIELVVLANTNLGKMEDAVASNGPETRFRITGLVTEYRGRNHLMIENVVIVPKVP